jgi:hypothetical protein
MAHISINIPIIYPCFPFSFSLFAMMPSFILRPPGGVSGGVVHANVGQNVTPHNSSLGLFLYHFLHAMVS